MGKWSVCFEVKSRGTVEARQLAELVTDLPDAVAFASEDLWGVRFSHESESPVVAAIYAEAELHGVAVAAGLSDVHSLALESVTVLSYEGLDERLAKEGTTWSL